MTRPNIDYVQARDCFKSPDNVRTQSDATADAELQANIAETGFLLENLIGVRVARGASKGMFEIFGGGRRLDAVLANIEEGVLDEEFMVPVLIAKDRKDAISMSLMENYFHLPMNPADECCAFRAIVEREKKTPADVARRFGKTETFVLGRLRLSNLADPIFAALRTGEIGIEVAKAYGTTPDQDRQAKVFEQLQGSYQRGNVNEIRRLLAVGSYHGGDPKALLVGRDAYLAAGGRIDHDLFADAASEIWLDGEIIERIADEALRTAAEVIREREGLAEIRYLSNATVPWSISYRLQVIEPEPAELPPELAGRQAVIETEIAAIEQEAEGQDDYTDDQAARLEVLNDELEALAPEGSVYTPAQKAGALGYVVLMPDGTPKLWSGLYAVEKVGDEAERPDSGDGDEDDAGTDGPHGEVDGTQEAAEEVDAGLGFSMRLRDELAMMRTELLALHIASDPRFALDLAIFIMADDACHVGWSGMPSELRARAPSPRVNGFASDTAAAQAWARLDEALDRSWVDHATTEARYDAFCALEDGARAAWLGWAIARTMQAVPDGMTGSPFLCHLGARLEIDVARWWRPTARNFFDRLTKPMILTLFQDIGGLELRNRYAGSRKFDLAVSAEKLFSGQVIADADVKARAVAWLPDPMQFASPERAELAAVPDDHAPVTQDSMSLAPIDPAVDEPVPDATGERAGALSKAA